MGKNKLLQNYNALKELPLVKKLILKNKNLKIEKKNLKIEKKNLKIEKKALLMLLSNSSDKSSCNCCNHKCCRRNYNEDKSLSEIIIKTEHVDLLDDEIEIIEPNIIENIVYEIYEDSDQEQNEQPLSCDINSNNEEEKKDDDRFVDCEKCNKHIDCYKDNIHIVYKGDPVKPTEELVLCTMCFQDTEDELIQQDYKCDEWEEIDEEDASESLDEDEEEDKNSFECDDCMKKGGDCFEEFGISKEEYDVYIELGEPDRCEDCFNKWKDSDNADEYKSKIPVEEEEEASEEEEEEASEEEEEEASEEEEEDASEEEEVDEEDASESVNEEEEEEASESVDEDEEEEEEEEASESVDEDEEEEVFEIEINGTLYYTTNEKSGDIYEVLEDEDIGDKVGEFVNKVAKFH